MADATADTLLPFIQKLENSGDEAVSPAGAVGRNQVMPSTAKALGFDPERLTEPDYNDEVAKAAINDLVRQHGRGDKEAIIAGYNASPSAVAKWKQSGRNDAMLPVETQGYLARFRKMMGIKPPAPKPDPVIDNGPPGRAAYQKLLDGGFSTNDVEAWKQAQTQKLQQGGFKPDEIASYWGETAPDTKSIDRLAAQDVQNSGEFKSNSLFLDFMAGYEHSAAGLAGLGKPQISQRNSVTSDIVAGTGQLIGDAPAMLGGVFASAPGGPLAMAAGGMAAPEAMRGILLDHYNHPEGFTNFADTFRRYAGIAWNTAKAGTMGLFFGVGAKAAAPIADALGGKLLGTGAELVAGNAAATVAGSAMDGQIPDRDSFIASSILLLGMHGMTRTVGATQRIVPSPQTGEAAANLGKIYERNGTSPVDVAQQAQHDPAVKFEAVSKDVNDEPVTPILDDQKPAEIKPKRSALTLADEHAQAMDELFTQAQVAAWGERPKDVRAPEEISAKERARAGFNQNASSVPIKPEVLVEHGFDPTQMGDKAYAERAGKTILGNLISRYKGDKEAAFIAFQSTTGVADAWLARGRKDASLPVETQKAVERADRTGMFRVIEGGKGGGKKPPGGEPPLEGEFKEVPPPKITDETIKLNTDQIEEKILGLVSKPTEKSWLDRGKDLFSTAYDRYTSELGPFKRMDAILEEQGKLKPGEVGIEDQFRSTYASADRAGHALTSGAIDPLTFKRVGKENLKGAYDLAKKNGGTKEGFVAYRLAERQIEKAEQGIDTGAPITLEQAQQLVKDNKGKYYDAARMAQRVNNAKLDYMQESGLYNKELVDQIKERNQAWIPHNRAPEAGEGPAIRTGRGPGKFQPRKTIKMMEGSDKQIVEPVIAEIESFHTAYALADRNRAVGSIVGSQEAIKQFGLKRIEQKPKMTIFNPDGSISKEALDIDPAELAHRELSGKLGPNEFPFFRDGRLEVWSANDPTIARVIRGATAVDTGLATGVARWAANLERSGITTLPDYIAKMVLRDQFTTPIVEKFGGLPFQNLLIGAAHVLKADEKWFDFVRNGGMGAALVDMDVKYIQRDVERVFAETGTLQAAINFVHSPIAAARWAMERADAMSRLGYFIRAQKAGQSSLKAGMGARKAYLDFQEKGTSGVLNWWASITPFLRPTILSFDQLSRALKENKTGMALKGIGYITIPTAALFAMNWMQDQEKDADDPSRYDQIPAWQRDTMWILPEVGGQRLRLPRSSGPVGVIFGGLTERMLASWANDDPRAFNGWATDLVSQFTPNVVPTIAAPVVEHVFNTSLFTGRSLVPATLEDASGYMQYTENTTEIAKAMSRYVMAPVGLDTSPIVLENYVRGWSGSLGQDVLKVLDAPISQNEAPWQLADVPFITSFVVRHPTMQATTIQNFFDDLKKVKEQNKNAFLAISRGNEQEINQVTDNPLAFLQLNQTSQALHQQSQAVHAIAQDKEMTNDEKRQAIDNIYEGMIATARSGLAIVDGINGSETP